MDIKDTKDTKARYAEVQTELQHLDSVLSEHYVPIAEAFLQEDRYDEAKALLHEIPSLVVRGQIWMLLQNYLLKRSPSVYPSGW
jgi:hypothetical protein